MIKRYLIIATLFALQCSVSTIAQTPVLQWVKQMGGNDTDAGKAMDMDASGNIVATGIFTNTAVFNAMSGPITLNGLGYDDVFVSKLDAAGNILWAKQASGDDYERVFDITTDSANNIYVVGYFFDTVDFNPGPAVYNQIAPSGICQSFVWKLDANGNFLWVKTLGGSSSANDVPYGAIKIDRAGNICIAIHFDGTRDLDPGSGTTNLTATFSDICLLKLDPSGNFIWAKQIVGSYFEVAYSMDVDSAGNIYVGGGYLGTCDFDPSPAVWNFTSPGSAYEAFIAAFDPYGDVMWMQHFGGPDQELVTDLVIAGDGSIYATGGFYGSPDFDPGTGNCTLINPGPSWDNAFVMRLDAVGNFLWAINIGAGEHDSGLSIDVDQYASCYITGYYSGTVDFDPGSGIALMSGVDPISLAAFVLKLDSNGEFVWAVPFLGHTLRGNSVLVDSTGNIYTAGVFQNTTDFNPGPLTTNLSTSSGWPDAFVHKMIQVPFGIHESSLNVSISVCPNPSVDLFYFTVPNGSMPQSVEVYNSLGEIIIRKDGMDQEFIVNMTDHADGFYVVKVILTGGLYSTVNIIKQ